MGQSISKKSSDLCSSPPPVGDVLGSGSFGTVYSGEMEHSDVVKAFKTKDHCDLASDEFRLQQQIFTVFDHARKSTDATEQQIASYIVVAEAMKFCPYKKSGYTFNKAKYGCFLVMSRLSGTPSSTKKYDLIPKSEWDKSGQDESDSTLKNKEDKDVMIQASLNAWDYVYIRRLKGWKGGHGFYNNKWKTKPIDKTNGLRGYFVNDAELADGKLLENLYKSLTAAPSNLDKNLIQKAIGFAFGRLIKAGYLGLDIEFTFGFYKDRWLINMLDFGKVLNVKEFETWNDKLKQDFGEGTAGKKIGNEKKLAARMEDYYIPACQYGNVKNADFQKGFNFGLNPKSVDKLFSDPVGMGHDGIIEFKYDFGIDVDKHAGSGSFHKVITEDPPATVKRLSVTDAHVHAHQMNYGQDYDYQNGYFMNYERDNYNNYGHIQQGPMAANALLIGISLGLICVCVWLVGMVCGFVAFWLGKTAQEYVLDSRKPPIATELV